MEETTQPLFQTGQLLAGKYRVERVIGEGGMGVVIAARHEQLNTDVAIKLLRTIALEHTDIVGRFMREARAAVSLRSEHVARVFDVGTLEDGRPYIVMERLEGQDLGAVCEAELRPSIGEAVDYVMQACEAIAEAHANGIIHRDLKPKNLFLTHAVHGRALVKVLDFGISKMAPTPGELQLTRTTEVIGSPSYMSPEQLRSARNVDARTDIWALGAILYELLTGRVPFFAETITELVLVVVTEQQPPVRSVRPEVPEGLEAVVNRCLAKNPDHRFQSVVELVQALEPFAHIIEATATDRVRAIGAPKTPGGNISGVATPRSTPNLPPVAASSSGQVPAIPAIPAIPSSHPSQPGHSGQVRVSGYPTPRGSGGFQPSGTSVAWGATQSAVPPALAPRPAPVKGSNAPIIVGVIAAAVVLLVGGAGGALWIRQHNAIAVTPQPSATSVPAAHESAMPLPDGRKDLPPTPAPTLVNPDPPAASGLPGDRKPGPAPTVKPVATAPKPPVVPPAATTKSTDLDGIGRR